MTELRDKEGLIYFEKFQKMLLISRDRERQGKQQAADNFLRIGDGNTALREWREVSRYKSLTWENGAVLVEGESLSEAEINKRLENRFLENLFLEPGDSTRARDKLVLTHNGDKVQIEIPEIINNFSTSTIQPDLESIHGLKNIGFDAEIDGRVITLSKTTYESLARFAVDEAFRDQETTRMEEIIGNRYKQRLIDNHQIDAIDTMIRDAQYLLDGNPPSTSMEGDIQSSEVGGNKGRAAGGNG